MNSIYHLKIHEGLEVEAIVNDGHGGTFPEYYTVIRVHNGWLYQTKSATTFVPYTPPSDDATIDNEGQLGNRER